METVNSLSSAGCTTEQTLNSAFFLQEESPFRKLQLSVNEQDSAKCWRAMGESVAASLRLGKAIKVKRFGLFGFFHPRTGQRPIQSVRGKQLVFVVAGQFGSKVRPGYFRGNRPVPLPHNSLDKVPEGMLNETECGIRAGLPRNTFKVVLDRILEVLRRSVEEGREVNMLLPGVGYFYWRKKLFAVKFLEYLEREVSRAIQLPLVERLARLRSNILPTVEQQDVRRASSLPPVQGPGEVEEEEEDGVEGEEVRERADFEDRRKVKLKVMRSQRRVIGWEDIIIKKIKSYLKEKGASAGSLFRRMLELTHGLVRPNDRRLGREQFITVMQKLRLYEIFEEEARKLFGVLDRDEDGFVDEEDWGLAFVEDRSKVDYLRGLMDNDSLLDLFSFKRRLNIRERTTRISADSLQNIIMRFDPWISEKEAWSIVDELMRGQIYIEPRQLQNRLLGREEKDLGFIQGFEERVGRWLASRPGNKELMTEVFEKYDVEGRGVLDPVNFQSCLMELNLGLEIKDIFRLGAEVEKDENGMVRYGQLLRKIVGSRPEFSLQKKQEAFVALLKEFASNRHVGLDEIIGVLTEKHTTQEPVPVREFIRLVREGIIKGYKNCNGFIKEVRRISSLQMLVIASFIDVDADGLVSNHDIGTFLSRFSLQQNLDVEREMRPIKLFPDVVLTTEKQIELALCKMRQHLDDRKVTGREFWEEVDLEGNGFITYEQFDKMVAKIVPLGSKARQSLFAYFDSLRVGFVDRQIFVEIMSRKNFKTNSKLVDSFDWQQHVLRTMRVWMQNARLSPTEAFRLIDRDFDGFISIRDLESFLREELKVPAPDLSPTNLHRLYKLLDTEKRNRAGLSDFIRVMSDTGKGGDWLESVLKQVGMFLLKNYKSLSLAFESISEFKYELKKGQLVRWLHDNLVLQGFVLTADMEQILFASLDLHRKGFIVESDFVKAFRPHFENQHQDLREAESVLYSNLQSREGIWVEVSKGNRHSYVDQKSFLRTMSKLSKSFHPERTSQLWAKACQDADRNPSSARLSRQEFESTFLKFTDQKTLGDSRLGEDLRRVEKVIRSEAVRVRELCQTYSKDGMILLRDLKNVLKKLHVGLTSRQIEQFLARLTDGTAIRLDRLEDMVVSDAGERRQFENPYLRKIEHKMLQSGVYPVDFFNRLDSKREGSLYFQQFYQSLLRECPDLCQENKHYVLSTLFETIDSKKDGRVDLSQWLKAFRQIKAPGSSNILYDPEYTGLELFINKNRVLLERLLRERESREGEVEAGVAAEVLLGVLEQSGGRGRAEDFAQLLRIGERNGLVDYKYFLKEIKSRL